MKKRMKSVLALILVIIFFMLSMVHFYWGLGGQLGFDDVLPTNESGVPMLSPTVVDCFVVGAVLLLFGFIYVTLLTTTDNKILIFMRKIGLWLIPLIFALRALGDFKYIGFFKQIESTNFAYWDTMVFSPLCLIVALIGFILLRK